MLNRNILLILSLTVGSAQAGWFDNLTSACNSSRLSAFVEKVGQAVNNNRHTLGAALAGAAVGGVAIYLWQKKELNEAEGGYSEGKYGSLKSVLNSRLDRINELENKLWLLEVKHRSDCYYCKRHASEKIALEKRVMALIEEVAAWQDNAQGAEWALELANEDALRRYDVYLEQGQEVAALRHRVDELRQQLARETRMSAVGAGAGVAT